MNDKSNKKWPSTAFLTIVTVLFLIYSYLLASHSIAGFPTSSDTGARWPWLGDRPVGEDGFYMLTVAYNFAATHRLVYTYDMPATGIQPLATIVFAGVAALLRPFSLSHWTLVRVIIMFGSSLFVLFSFTMAYLSAMFAPKSQQRLVFGLAFLLALFDFTAFRLFTYGLETGLYLCSLAVCFIVWRRLVATPTAEWSQLLLFGLASGIAGLARIDFGILFASLLLILLLKRKINLIQAMMTGLVALVCVSPWFLFVHRVSGFWLPSSGKAESRIVTYHDVGHRLPLVFLSATAHLAPWSFSGSTNLPTGIVGALSLVLLFFVFRSATQTRTALSRAGEFRDVFLPWIISIVVLTLIYFSFFWSTHFYTRYFAPILIVSIPLLALALAEQAFVRHRPLVVFSVLLVIFCGWDVVAFHTGHVYAKQILSASYIEKWYPHTRVGSFQSGTVGYFEPNVENLDGKLNQGALLAAQAGKLPSFIDTEKINVIVDWPDYVESLPADYREREWQICPHPTSSPDTFCIVRKSFLADQAWAR